MIGSELLAVASWYLAATVLGWTTLPIAWRLFHRLQDRGLAFSRPLGLLAVGYVIWLAGSLGVISNTTAAIVGVWLLWAVAGALALRGRWDDFTAWLRGRRRTILMVEALFLLAFVGWALVRSYDPGIRGTEKPMELAFLNAVLQGQGFPPADPWLSGYAISYYYFGFVMMGLLTKVTAVAPGVAFNLTISLWFALTVVAAYGVVYNLIGARSGRSGLLAGLLGPAFVAISGNLEGFLELLHTRGVFWSSSAQGGLRSAFWRWLDIKDLVNPPFQVGGWLPDRHWWWWRASRVVRDVDFAGADVEVIDEFPFFSFLLADNHPHVLALPFVLMAIAFALHYFLDGERELVRLSAIHRSAWFKKLLWLGGAVLGVLLVGARWAGAAAAAEAPLTPAAWTLEVLAPSLLTLASLGLLTALLAGALPSALPLGPFALAAWVFGSLAFLNAWDFPIYLALLGLVLVWSLRDLGWTQAFKSSAATGLGLLVASVLLYLPWYPTFSSQAGGVLPNLAYRTKLQHFIVMFAPLLVPIVVWTVRRLRRNGSDYVGRLLAIGFGLPLALFAASWLLAGLIAAALEPNQINAIIGAMGAPTWELGVQEALRRRALHPWTSLVLGLLLAASAVLLLRSDRRRRSEASPAAGSTGVWPFIAMLSALGALLVLVPEFFYIRDTFGTRMNTVFKFYYAAWVLWGIAAAYTTYELWPREDRGSWLRTLVALPLLLGLFYPVMGIASRTAALSSERARTLDGVAHLQFGRPEDLQAIEWINQNLSGGVIAEAVGGSYSEYGRIATHTPLTTVLGWEFHEVQWRGSAAPQGSRRADIERLYQTADRVEAQRIVEQYGIDYVYIGSLERSSYGAIRRNKFEAFMTPVYERDSVVIYAVERGVTSP